MTIRRYRFEGVNLSEVQREVSGSLTFSDIGSSVFVDIDVPPGSEIDADEAMALRGYIFDTSAPTIPAAEQTAGELTHADLSGLPADDHTQYILADGSRAFTGNQSVGGFRITSLATPVVSSDAATRGFVESQIQGLDPKGSVDAATTAALPANSRIGDVLTADANGAFPAVDGVAAALNNVYLVKNEVDGVNNGQYELTDVGSANTPWELTRTANFAGGASVAGAFIGIERGTTPPSGNKELTFLCTNDRGSDVVNANALTFVPFSILITNSTPADVTKAVAAVGVATEAARADHKHDVTTAVAGTIAVGDAAAEGTAAFLARSDHTHALPTPAAPADVTKAAAAAGTASETARADHKHDVTTAAPSTATGTTNSEGSASSLARSDHVHRVELGVLEEGVSTGDRPRLNFIGNTIAAVDNPGSDRIDVTITAAAVTVATPTQIDAGDAAAVGVATDAARADHQHAVNTALAATIAAVDAGAAAAGVSATVPRGDHKHSVSTAAPSTATGTTNAEGSATSLARSDHGHRLGLEVLDEGTLTGTRPRLNFIGAAVSLVDNGGSDRVDVTIAAAALTASTPTSVDAGDAGVVGVATDAARSDHQHAVSTAVAVGLGSANAEGTATSLSRSDHVHARDAAGGDLSGTLPNATVVAVGGTTAAIIGAHPARVDNPHAVTAAQVAALPLAGGTISGRILILSAADIQFQGGSGNNFLRGNVANTGRLSLFTENIERLSVSLAGVVNAISALQVAGIPVVVNTRTITAGDGLTGGGDLSADRTFDVALTTDAQHGVRGGGTQHADVVAGGADGFMTGADKTKLDGVAIGAIANIVEDTTPQLGGNLDTNGKTISDALGTVQVDDDLFVTGDLRVSGNALIQGTTTTVESETVLVNDNHLYLNNSYATVAPETGGLVVNYLPTATSDTVTAGAFVAGVPATSNPTVATVGAATFSPGDLIQIGGAADLGNNGIFEALSHAGNVLTIRGIGLTSTVEDFTQNQFTANASDSATITKINLSIMRAGVDGAWETAAGSGIGLPFQDLLLAPPAGFTVGSVIFASAASKLSEDNANFSWDDVLNRLSIGNLRLNGNLLSTASGDLDITTGTGGVFKLTTNALRAGQDAANYLEIGHGGSNAFLDRVGAGGIDFRFGGATLATFTSAGHLHLLTSVDQKHTLKLKTNNNLNATGIAFENSGGSFTGTIFRQDVGSNRADMFWAVGLNADIDLLKNALVIRGDAAKEGEVEVLVALQVNNLRLTGNKLSSTDANGDIALIPDGSGNVEIVGVPGAVVGGFASGALQVRDPTPGVTRNAVITGHNSDGGNKQLWYLGSTSSSNLDIAFINRQNADLFFSTNNAERMRLTADGVVSIGTGSPRPSAILQTDSTTLGTLGVRWTAAQEITNVAALVAADEGLTWFNTTTKELRRWNGTAAVSRPRGISAQLSDSVDQTPGSTTPTVITYDTQDEIQGITHSTSVNPGEITIVTSGTYYVMAQPQVGKNSGGTKIDFNMFLQVDTGSGFADVVNSNIKLSIKDADITDVIVSGFTTRLAAGDKIRMMQAVSAVGSGIGLKATAAQGSPSIPATPSIIFTMFLVDA